MHSGPSNRAALIQVSNPDPTTKLDKRADAPSSTTSTPILANSITNYGWKILRVASSIITFLLNALAITLV